MTLLEVLKVWRRNRWLVRAVLVGCLAVGAPLLCNRNEYFRVTVSVSPKLEAGKLEQVSVTVGPEKSSWPELSAGETVGVSLFPGRDEIPVVSLSFAQEGGQQSFVARDYVFGAGYRVLLTVDEQGGVSEARCRRPCSLEEE